MKYRVLDTLTFDGRRYKEGDTVSMKDDEVGREQAKILIDLKVIALYEEEVDDKVDDKKKKK